MRKLCFAMVLLSGSWLVAQDSVSNNQQEMKDSKGEITVQTKGYAGTDCLQASRFLEQALGVATADHKSAEFFQTSPVEQQVQQ